MRYSIYDIQSGTGTKIAGDSMIWGPHIYLSAEFSLISTPALELCKCLTAWAVINTKLKSKKKDAILENSVEICF